MTVITPGGRVALPDPTDGMGEANVAVIRQAPVEHLLLTVTSGEYTWVWVLVPSDSGLQVVLAVQCLGTIKPVWAGIAVTDMPDGESPGSRLADVNFLFDPTTGRYKRSTVP
ncbi:MAG: hypothetical protein ACOY94_03585 [Bacillota bacterium]